MADALFEVLIPNPNENISVVVPSAQPRGLFWTSDDAANAAAGTLLGQMTAKLAAVTDQTLLGFNGRAITTTGLRTDAEILFNEGLEGPDKVGGYTSLSQPPLLFVVEDDGLDTYISATNPLSAVGDLVGFVAGKAHIAQSTEYAHYRVVGKEPGQVDATKFRYVLQKLDSTVEI